jgi:hypothetical protein
MKKSVNGIRKGRRKGKMKAQILILDDKTSHEPRIIFPYDVEDMGGYDLFHFAFDCIVLHDDVKNKFMKKEDMEDV